MEPAEYRDELRSVLDTASAVVSGRLSAIHNAATPRTEGIVIDVSLDQDGEGTFGVWARFEGPDAFSLNQQVGDERELFGVIWGEEGWEPPVPHRPREWSHAALEEVIVGVVAEWIGALVPPTASELRWEVTTPDGATDPIPVGPDFSRGHSPR
ncbi:DUF6389 family protein [Rhodococcus sp. IEGM 1318]|uniref:DUF6389 family protein n=1 Tax=Rhodococcus sp. IEGM 1318 TaxID=3082226 RepID=UPI0029552A1F|nr:DUF6389 family protein [Rhodococcus sp. IEGM 1318]MDV8005911.1 DUF6389 family protein [Rhodococcus sp. IEGM 1318]